MLSGVVQKQDIKVSSGSFLFQSMNSCPLEEGASYCFTNIKFLHRHSDAKNVSVY